MLEVAELRALAAWCRSHAFRWAPTLCDDGIVAMILEAPGRRAWQRMTLTLRDDGFHLVDETGVTLATASDLQAVLDALDGGVAEPEPAVRPRPASASACVI